MPRTETLRFQALHDTIRDMKVVTDAMRVTLPEVPAVKRAGVYSVVAPREGGAK